jgi:RNA polymerase sigma-70 factor (ECF subfamily)
VAVDRPARTTQGGKVVPELQLRPQRPPTSSRTAPEETPEMARVIALAVERAKEGDREALQFLYVRYARNIHSYVRSIVGDDHDAEDVTQIVFMKLMTVLVRYEQRSVPFFGWLLRLAHNTAIDHIRSRRAVPVEEVRGADERAPSDGDLTMTVTAALETLSAQQRDVVFMRHVVGLTPGEIAGRLGRTESSVHGLHHRGRRALREELLKMNAGPSTVPAA